MLTRFQRRRVHTTMDPRSIVFYCILALFGTLLLYLAVLILLALSPTLQTHAVYLHRVTLTWFKDLSKPEEFGFLPHQVTPFAIQTSDNERLLAWHVLPIETYLKNQEALFETSPGCAQGKSLRHSPRLLRDDPEARLVLYFHGTAGCIASGWRPDSYRALSSTVPGKIHVLAFDYRGYGLSTGIPSEAGLPKDASAVVHWAINEARVPPSRIAVYGQSLGTAVAIATVQHFAAQDPPARFAGLVLTASFSDTASLTATYRIGGLFPVLSPIARFPALFRFFTSFLTSTWLSKDRLAAFVAAEEHSNPRGHYHITLLHAEDDNFIVHNHSDNLYRYATQASMGGTTAVDQFEAEKNVNKRLLGTSGWMVEHTGKEGVIRQLKLKTGLHDRIMAYPISAAAVLRALRSVDSGFGPAPDGLI